MLDSFVLEVSDCKVEIFYRIFNKSFTLLRIDGKPIPIHPGFSVVDPVGGGEPEMRVWKKILRHFLNLWVICDFPFEEMLSRIVLSGLSCYICQSFIDHSNLLGNFGMMLFFVIVVELLDGFSKRFKGVFELLLAMDHLFLKFQFLRIDIIFYFMGRFIS